MTRILSLLEPEFLSKIPEGTFDGKVALIRPKHAVQYARLLCPDPARDKNPDGPTCNICEAMAGQWDAEAVCVDFEGQRDWDDFSVARIVEAFASATGIPTGVYRMHFTNPARARVTFPDWYPKITGDRHLARQLALALQSEGTCRIVPTTSPDITERDVAPRPASLAEIGALETFCKQVDAVAVWARTDSDPQRVVDFVKMLRGA